MLPVAIVLLLLLIVVVVGVVISNPDPATLNIFVAQIPTTGTGVFLIGFGAAIAFCAALVLLAVGIRRSRAQHAERRALEKAAGRPAPQKKLNLPKLGKKRSDAGGTSTSSTGSSSSGSSSSGSSTSATTAADPGPRSPKKSSLDI
ncbi:hypothetical protein [Microlunatus sp. Y2014]|uniref:hypothetical protein n=1 Tax=Microlunatus sp. Y2014 TaxID=3418488 RepID=UPI003DA76877